VAGTGAGTGGVADTGGGTGGGAAGEAAGDVSHCKAGRQFDPAIDFFAPPCVAKWAAGNNGGSTYQGVSGTTIKVIRYYDHLNDAINTLLKASGAYVSADQYRALLGPAHKLI